jgi:hypothetical protein
MEDKEEIRLLKLEIEQILSSRPKNWGDWGRIKCLDFKDVVVAAKRALNSPKSPVEKLSEIRISLRSFYA